MKKIFLAVILVIGLLPFTACQGELPPAGEIIDNMVKAMDEVETYRQDTDVTMQLYFMAEDVPSFSPLDIDVELNAVTAHDLVNNNMETVMDVVIAGADDDSIKVEIATYLIDMTMYVMVDFPIVSPMWTKSEIPGMYTQQIDNFQTLAEVLQMAGMEITGTERKEGINCYVLELTPDISQIFNSLMGLAGEYDAEYSESDLEVIDEIFSDFSVKIWVAHDTYRVVYADINIQMEFSPETVGVRAGEGIFSLDTTIRMHYHDYNRSVKIDLPPEAEDADEGSLW